MNPVYSVVIPVYNEESNIEELNRRLSNVMRGLCESYEIVFVNDGSRDRSMEMLEDLSRKDPQIKVVELSRNFGHQAAISAGLQYASGSAVIVMDGDLQDPPEIIPQYAEKWREGCEVVYAVRKTRKEGLWKRMLYKSFYRLLKLVANTQIPLDSGDFCLMDRKVVDLLNRMPERNRFVRGLRSWVGFRQVALSYDRDARYAGSVKYTLAKLVALALDGFFSFSYIPLRLISIFGFVVSLTGFCGIILVLYLRLSGRAIPGTASTLILILFIGGVQLIAAGIAGEYIGRIYEEVKNRPQYIVRKTCSINIKNE